MREAALSNDQCFCLRTLAKSSQNGKTNAFFPVSLDLYFLFGLFFCSFVVFSFKLHAQDFDVHTVFKLTEDICFCFALGFVSPK